MASIRRTLSPYQSDRSHSHHQNGNSSPFSPTTNNTSSPSHKQHQQQSILFPVPRKSYRRRPSLFYTCILFFLLGILLGLAPFGQLLQQQEADVVHDFSFQPNNLHVTPTLDVLKQEEDNNIVLDKVELASLQDSPPAPATLLKKQIIVVTPTYNRPLQAYYLNRLGHLLRLVPKPLLWIVVEMDLASTHTADILRGMGIMYRHLVCTKNLTNIKDRGVHQRNRALEHIEHHKLDGIVYFADDDNVYSLQLFEAIRQITRFGTWPVAMLAQSKNKATLEGPVCNGSQVIGWHTNDKSKRLRRFHVDMSGFAFNSTILWDPNRWKKPASPLIRQLDTVKEGFQETTFIEQLVEDETQMEATPLGCSKIMNWHLHLEAHELGYPKGWLLQKNLDSLLPIDYNKDR